MGAPKAASDAASTFNVFICLFVYLFFENDKFFETYKESRVRA